MLPRTSASACRRDLADARAEPRSSTVDGGYLVAIPLHQAMRVGAYVVGQHLARRQALSAGADARAAVPLQSRLRRLRQDRLSRRDPQPAPLGRRMPGGGRRMRRAGGLDRRRRTAAAPRHRRDRRAASSAARNSSISAPTRCCWKRRSTSSSRDPYFTWSIHLDGDRGDARPLGLPGRRLRPRGRGDQARQSQRASASTSTAPSSTGPSPSGSRLSSTI